MTPPATPQERLIAAVRDRAFDALERDRGELQPIGAWIDDTGRIGLVSVYAGHDYPEPDLHLVEVRSALKLHARREGRIAGAVTAHRDRLRVPGLDDPFEFVCVQYEARGGEPLRVYYPYRIKKRLSGRSEVTRMESISVPGSDPVFP